jgi:hypothetical protein
VSAGREAIVNGLLTIFRLVPVKHEPMGNHVRRIQVEDGLALRFPGRGEEFNEGVEIGILAAMMSSGQRGFTQWMSTDNIEQARAIAEKLGYHLTTGEVDGILTEVTFRTGRARPTLTLVHSRVEADQKIA